MLPKLTLENLQKKAFQEENYSKPLRLKNLEGGTHPGQAPREDPVLIE